MKEEEVTENLRGRLNPRKKKPVPLQKSTVSRVSGMVCYASQVWTAVLGGELGTENAVGSEKNHGTEVWFSIT